MVNKREVGQIWNSLGRTERIRIAECGLRGSSRLKYKDLDLDESEFINLKWKDIIPPEKTIIVRGMRNCGLKV